ATPRAALSQLSRFRIVASLAAGWCVAAPLAAQSLPSASVPARLVTPGSDATPQQVWEWEQSVRDKARTAYKAEVIEARSVEAAIATLEALLQWLDSEQARAAAKTITWLPFQKADIHYDLALAHAVLQRFDGCAAHIDAECQVYDAGLAPKSY